MAAITLPKMAKWQIATPREVTRPLTEKERVDLRNQLHAISGSDAFKKRIDETPAGEARDKMVGDYEYNEREIERLISITVWKEWVNEYRDPTPAEVKQDNKDTDDDIKLVAQMKSERASRVAILRQAAKNMGLSNKEFLLAFPSDILLEEMDKK